MGTEAVMERNGIVCSECAHSFESAIGLACGVHGDAGSFAVPKDGFCHLAKRRCEEECGDCMHFRFFASTGSGGVMWDGVCCVDGVDAAETDSWRFACEMFEGRESK